MGTLSSMCAQVWWCRAGSHWAGCTRGCRDSRAAFGIFQCVVSEGKLNFALRRVAAALFQVGSSILDCAELQQRCFRGEVEFWIEHSCSSFV